MATTIFKSKIGIKFIICMQKHERKEILKSIYYYETPMYCVHNYE